MELPEVSFKIRHPIGFADYRSVVDYDLDRLGVEAYEWLLFSISIVNRLVRSHGFVFFRIPFVFVGMLALFMYNTH